MEDEEGVKVFLENMPFLSIWYKALFVYLFQIIIFIAAMIFFWQISSNFLIGALLGEFIIVFIGISPYRYVATNIEKIRENYKKKYGKLTAQYFWFRYESYTIPLLSSSFYFPLLLKTDYFLPAIIHLPSHFITNSLFPHYSAIPIGILIIIFGILIRKPSGGFGPDVETYLYLLYPKKGKLIKDGMYKYIRNPRYLSRGIIAVGFGVLANNILAIGIGFIHFLAFCSLIPPEDKELSRRFGGDFWEYKKKVPALFPRYGNWRKFVRFIISGEKKK